MSVLLHVSDTHFGTERAEVLLALERLVLVEQPDVLVLSGDITQRASDAQFKRARAWLDDLPIAHRLLLPGNHDVPLYNLWQRLLTPYARYQRWLSPGSLAPELQVAGFHIFGVKTTRRLRHIDGEVSETQRETVAQQLRQADRSCLRIVVTHQPLWVDRAVDWHNRCRGADAALQQWCAAGADVFLAGHIHWPLVAAVPQRASAWAVNAGTAVSHRVRDGVPNSVNLVRYTSGMQRSCIVERWDCPAQSREFVPVRTQVLALASH